MTFHLEPTPFETPIACSFFIPGIPCPGGSKRGFALKKGGAYTGRVIITDDAGQRNKDWKAKCAQVAHECDLTEPFRGPLRVDFDFVMPRIKSHFRANGALKEGAPRWHVVKPDRTKLTRSTEDALTGIVWADDAQVVAGSTTKTYGDQAGCRVTVTPL